jgi:hypothetical protein
MQKQHSDYNPSNDDNHNTRYNQVFNVLLLVLAGFLHVLAGLVDVLFCCLHSIRN